MQFWEIFVENTFEFHWFKQMIELGNNPIWSINYYEKILWLIFF